MAVLDRVQVSPEEATKYAGQWVVIKADHVLFAADDPADVIAWLRKTGTEADLVTGLPAKNASDHWLK
jgi:Family of unknown function (DUF5678)